MSNVHHVHDHHVHVQQVHVQQVHVQQVHVHHVHDQHVDDQHVHWSTLSPIWMWATICLMDSAGDAWRVLALRPHLKPLIIFV